MGFIDNASQVRRKENYRVFTAYYCFDSIQRILFASITDKAQEIVTETIKKICLYFNQDISSQVEKVFIKVMGHAMPIPKIGYLFNDKNLVPSELKHKEMKSTRQNSSHTLQSRMPSSA
jgi:hypothetical protein